jgi:ABC-type phosphate/phosphonate transport system substrate-binding protein
MSIKSVSQKNSIFFGIVFILLACIVLSAGILWKGFVEYHSNATGLPDAFSGITQRPPFKPEGLAYEKDEVVFTFTIPRGDLVRFLEMVQPRLDSIVGKISKQAVIDISTDETEIIKKIERGQADFGSLSTMGFVNFMNDKAIRPVLQRYSKPPKRSLFIVRRNENIRTLADLKNKRIAFKDKYSLPGYLLPVSEIKSQGFEVGDFFAQEYFTGNYSNSMLGLLNNEFDVIVAASNFLFEVSEDKRKKIKVIHESREIPGGVYVVKKGRRIPFEQIITGNFMKLSDSISSNEVFSGMFKVKKPDLEAFTKLAREFGHER